MKSILIKIVLLPIIGLIATIFFTALFLPEDEIKIATERGISSGLGGDYEVKIKDLNIGLLGSIDLKHIVLTPPNKAAGQNLSLSQRIDLDRRVPDKTGEEGVKRDSFSDPRCPVLGQDTSYLYELDTVIPHISFSPSIGQLIGGELQGPLRVDLPGGGFISGDLAHESSKGSRIKAEIRNLDPQTLPIIMQKYIPESFRIFQDLAVFINLDVDLLITEAGWDGSLDFFSEDLTLCQASFKKGKDVISLGADLRFGTLNGAIVFDPDGKTSFKDFKTEGGRDGWLQVTGEIVAPKAPSKKKRWNLEIRLFLNDEFLDHHGLKSLIGGMCKRFKSDGTYRIMAKGLEGTKNFQTGCVPPSGSPNRGGSKRRGDARPSKKNRKNKPAPLPRKERPLPPERDPEPVQTGFAKPHRTLSSTRLLNSIPGRKSIAPNRGAGRFMTPRITTKPRTMLRKIIMAPDYDDYEE